MLAVIATVVFAVAFVINATGTDTAAVFTPTSLLLVGLALVAAHLGGLGSGARWSGYRGRRR